MIQERSSAEERTDENRPVSDLVDADLLACGVTCRGWSAPLAAGWPDQVGDRRARVLRMACTGGALATGILDFGWGARSQESSTQALYARRLFSWRADSPRLSLSFLLGSLPVLACSCLRAGWLLRESNLLCPPAPTCLPYLCPYLLPCFWPYLAPARRHHRKYVHSINNCHGDVVLNDTRVHSPLPDVVPRLMTLRYSR